MKQGKARALAGLFLVAPLLQPSFAQAATPLAPPPVVLDSLIQKGFDCHKIQNAHICTVKSIDTAAFKYPKPVGIIVPDGLRYLDNIIIHMHGFQNVCRRQTISAPAGIISDFNLAAGLQRSGLANAVMVVPLSTGNVRTFKHHLLPDFGDFVRWTKQQLNSANPALHLSGHSGAGPIISSALARNPDIAANVRSITLLDATYRSSSGVRDTMANWRKIVAERPEIKIYSIYRPDTATQTRSLELKKAFPSNVELTRTKERHCTIPNRYLGLNP